MKGDFTRDTFDATHHYRQVLQQQGRVQLDADWNEQAALVAHRSETALADMVGDCGGPADEAAFAVITTPSVINSLPANPGAPIRQFALSQGRYYVNGLLCEVESPFLFSWQPDHRETSELADGNYLVYLDVWLRHLTVHERDELRETALVGPDTATRVKTVWQVRAAALPSTLEASPCRQTSNEFDQRQRSSFPELAARTETPTFEDDPCKLPATAGYRGLENQLYRVEIHNGGNLGAATFKWSRDNGAVATRIIKNVDKPVTGGSVNVLTVASTGPDDSLGFRKDDLVEVLHDSDELEGVPGKLAQVAEVDDSEGTITLKRLASEPMPIAITVSANPRLRRWDGMGTVPAGPANPADGSGFAPLELGVQVGFRQPGSSAFRTGRIPAQIPARTASPDAESGKIEWPLTSAPDVFLQPRGILHHYCRLGVITVAGGAVTPVSDCRCLWPALTAPRLEGRGGDGQEVMPSPDAPAALIRLPQPLEIFVANLQCATVRLSLRLRVTPTADRLEITPPGGALVASDAAGVLRLPNARGLLHCSWLLNPTQTLPNRKVEVDLVDPADVPVAAPPPLLFTANLSIASQVGYNPGECGAAGRGLEGRRTVQDAIARLASMVSLYKVSGDGQVAAPGSTIEVRVRVASRCGPESGLTVAFNAQGGGSVVSSSPTNDGTGDLICRWQLGPTNPLQTLEAVLTGDANRPVTEPSRVHFLAHLTGEGNNDPEPVHILGLRVGKEKRVLINHESTLTTAELEEGIFVICDRAIDPSTVVDPINPDDAVEVYRRGQPTCFLTVEIPHGTDQDFRSVAYYESAILNGMVTAADPADEPIPPSPPLPEGTSAKGLIVWRTFGAARDFLERLRSRLQQDSVRPDKLLLRFTLKGSFIWNTEARELFRNGVVGGFLDGESFRTPPGFIPSALLLPSGDNRRGGDFEMWFWMALPAPNEPPQISGIAPVVVAANQATTVTFDVFDPETAPNQLLTTAVSSNQTLIPNGNLALAGSGNTRALRLIPASGQIGRAIISVVVQDPTGASSATSFDYEVRSKTSDVPKFTDVLNKSTDVAPKFTDNLKATDAAKSDFAKATDVSNPVDNPLIREFPESPGASGVGRKKSASVRPASSKAEGKAAARKPGRSFIRPGERPSTNPGSPKKPR